MRHFGITTSADGTEDSVEPAVGRVVDDPATFVILVNVVNLGIENGFFLESIKFPNLADLVNKLISLWIAARVLDFGMKPVFYAVNLEARCGVDFLFGRVLASIRV